MQPSKVAKRTLSKKKSQAVGIDDDPSISDASGNSSEKDSDFVSDLKGRQSGSPSLQKKGKQKSERMGQQSISGNETHDSEDLEEDKQRCEQVRSFWTANFLEWMLTFFIELFSSELCYITKFLQDYGDKLLLSASLSALWSWIRSWVRV